MKEESFVSLVGVIGVLVLLIFLLVGFLPSYFGESEYVPVYGDTIVILDDNDSAIYLVEILDSVEIDNGIEWGPTEFRLWNE